MGLRYRKELRVIKLIRLNVSKSGVSTTIGVPGLSVNIGRRGIFRNLGLPGSGLFMRDRICAPSAMQPGAGNRAVGYLVIAVSLLIFCATLIGKFL